MLSFRRMGEARDVFIEVCQTIVAALEPNGYRWIKSQNDLARKDGPFTFRLHFQSSHRNFLAEGKNAGRSGLGIGRIALIGPALFVPLPIQLLEINQYGSVKMIPHIQVDDARIAKWRRQLQKPLRLDSSVTSANLGYLSQERSWLEINLANPLTRASRLTELITLIQSAAFPFFERFHRDEKILAER